MTVRIGLIGAGGMGRAHVDRIANVLAGAKVVAIADINEDGAKAVAEPLGAKAYTSGPELINDPDVDAVLIATFGNVHVNDLLACIEAGKPVLCEKPMVTTADDAIKVMEAEQKAGKKLVTVGFMRRFDASYREMKATFDAGEHGDALLVHCRHRNPLIPVPYYTTENMLDDTSIHEFDICRFLLGEEITRIRVDVPKHSKNAREDLQDPLVWVGYTESGTRIDSEVNVNCQFGYSIECELVMESGTVLLGDQEKTHVRDTRGHRNAMAQSHIDRFEAAFNTEVQEWIRAVENCEHTGPTAWDGYAAVTVVDASLAALADGQEHEITQIEKPDFYA